MSDTNLRFVIPDHTLRKLLGTFTWMEQSILAHKKLIVSEGPSTYACKSEDKQDFLVVIELKV